MKSEVRPYDVMLSGYYGFGNSGDEALLQAILHDLRVCRPGIRIVVLSHSPEETAKRYGVKAVDRMKLSDVRRWMKKTKLLLSGGGSLIQDSTSSQSLYYYLTLIQMAGRCGCRVMLYANGVGPVHSRWNRFFCGKILDRVDQITLREPDSLEELKKMGVTRPPALVTADPAIGLAPCPEEETNRLLSSLHCERPLMISLRSWKNFDRDISTEVKKYMIEMRSRYGCKSLLLPMQPSRDLELCRRTAHGTDAVVLDPALSVEQVLGLMSKSTAVIGMRLHALIYAAAAGTPPVGIVYDPKVEGYLRYMGLDSFLGVDQLNAAKLVQLTAKAVENGYGTDLTQMRRLAYQNAEIAVSLLDAQPGKQ